MGTKISELIQRTPDGQEYFEVIIPPFTPGTNRKVLLSDLSAIIGGAVDSVNGQTGVVQVNADDVPFTPAGNLSATDVQAMGEELDSEKVAKVNAAVALTDAGTIDLTAIKHTLTTGSSRTFTISYTGDDITIEVTLTATSATQTFPAAALCISEGLASGDNTCVMTGDSGDKYIIAIKKVGSAYYVICKNFAQ